VSRGDRWNAVAALVDRSRRALYDYVRRQDHPVTREEAAEAQGMSRNLTAFHLDKLVESGLLCARYEAPPDQPRGRGRAPKVYEPVGDGVAVTIPERRYELIAEILADAIANDPTHAEEAAHRHALQRGRDLGAQARQTALVCGLNHTFLTGLLDGIGRTDVQARLEPRRSTCCVELAV
jgi:predicted ArsR family transcriptional regulator